MFQNSPARFCLLIGLILVNVAYGQPTRKGPIRLERADVLKSQMRGGQPVKVLIGDVKITQDDLTVTCDRATYFEKEGRLDFKGNVTFTDARKILKAQEVTYLEGEGKARAEKDVRIREGRRSIKCRVALYYEYGKKANFKRDVVVKDRDNNLTLMGGAGFYHGDSSYYRVTEGPKLVKRDSLDRVELTIVGRTMEYFSDPKEAVVTDSVSITKGGLVATCGRAHYYYQPQRVVLRLTPVAWQEGNRLSGEEITLFIEGQDIHQVYVTGGARAESEVDSLSDKINVLTSRELTMFVEDDQVRRILAQNNATSFYYIFEDGEDQGRNEASGDSINLFFENKKIHKIEVIGGTLGTYCPPED